MKAGYKESEVIEAVIRAVMRLLGNDSGFNFDSFEANYESPFQAKIGT